MRKKRVDFDLLMPTLLAMNSRLMISFYCSLNKYDFYFSIFAWKRLVIPPNPDRVQDIDTSGPFFLLPSGESMVKVDTNVGGLQSSRFLGMTSDKLMEYDSEVAEDAVMDAHSR